MIAVLFAPDAALGEGVFWHHDLKHHHYPWRAWGAATWATGEVPWWAPGAGNGFPLLAEGEGGLLYPPTMLLFLALPDGAALNASILAHQVLAAMGVWAFLRARGLRGVAPLLGGAVYAWSGFLVSHTLYLGMQNGAAWAGWALFGAATARWGVVALAVGMLGLAGHPQIAAFLGLGLAVHALATLRGRALAAWGAAVAVGSVVASPQLLATLELVRYSQRDGGVSAVFAQIGRLPVQELVGAVFPYAFGYERPADVAQTYVHRGEGYWGAGVNHWEMCFYLGFPVVVLALAGARRARGWVLGAAAAGLLMLGGPAWELVRHLPGFDGFRFPARFAVLLTLAAAVLAAEGVEALRRARRPGRLAGALRVSAAVFALGAGAAYGSLHVFEAPLLALGEARFANEAPPPAPPAPPSALEAAALPAPDVEDPARAGEKARRILADLRESTRPTSPRVWVPVALLLLASFAIRRPAWWFALAVGELWRFGHAYHPRVPTNTLDARPAWLSASMIEPGGPRLTVLDRHVDPALDTAIGTASLGLLWGTSDVIVPSPLLFLRNDALLARAGLDIGNPTPEKASRYLTHLDAARRLGVRWVATTHTLPGLVPIATGTVNVYEDPGAYPRARVVPCARGAADADAAFARVGTTDGAREVVVEGLDGDVGCDADVVAGAGAGADGAAGADAAASGDGARATSAGAATAGVPATGAATIVAYAPLAVTVRATGPGTLVLADTWYPRWTAALDGAPVEILRADVNFRGIALPAGEHEVVFRYAPGVPGRALGVALVALAGIAVAIGARERRGRGR